MEALRTAAIYAPFRRPVVAEERIKVAEERKKCCRGGKKR
jgi:hypothetical protein